MGGFAERYVESFKDKTTTKGKAYLAVKIVDLGWASCWDTKIFPALKAAAANGTPLKMDISQSDKTDNQGNPFLSVESIWIGEEDGGGPAEGAERATSPAAPRPPAPAPALRPAAPPPGPAAAPRPAPAPLAASASDAQTRATVALSASMLAWGGAIAKTPAEVVRWIGIFDQYVRTGVLPQVPDL